MAKAGETCLVNAGTYDERVTVVNSGTAGNLITFRANGSVKLKGFSGSNKSYVTIQGFELTHLGLTAEPVGSDSSTIVLDFTDHFQILNNTIHDTIFTCIQLRAPHPSNFTIIKGNKIYHCGALGPAPGVGIEALGDNNLIDSNDIYRNGDDFTRVTGGKFNVVRNNYWHDNLNSDYPGSTAHIDGMQNFCSTDTVIPLNYILIEGNYMNNAPDYNSHFSIYQDYGPCGESDAIMRNNTAKNIGSSFGFSDLGFKNGRIYNNSLVDMSVASNPKEWNIIYFGGGSTGGKIINNIFYNVNRDYGNAYDYDSTSAAGFYANFNLGYNSFCGSTCTWYNPPNGISKETNAVLNKDPLFVNVANDFHLQSPSPAIDKGGPLTQVASSDAGSGTSLVVADAGFFQDGWAGVSPDWIAIGTPTNAAQISSTNYFSNTITLASSISRKAGDPVYLYKNSSGTQVLYGNAPDIGAFESTYSGTVQPPAVTGDFNKDGVVNSIDLSLMAGAWNTNNATYDLNKDGTVNTLDYAIMVRNWTP